MVAHSVLCRVFVVQWLFICKPLAVGCLPKQGELVTDLLVWQLLYSAWLSRDATSYSTRFPHPDHPAFGDQFLVPQATLNGLTFQQPTNHSQHMLALLLIRLKAFFESVLLHIPVLCMIHVALHASTRFEILQVTLYFGVTISFDDRHLVRGWVIGQNGHCTGQLPFLHAMLLVLLVCQISRSRYAFEDGRS